MVNDLCVAGLNKIHFARDGYQAGINASIERDGLSSKMKVAIMFAVERNGTASALLRSQHRGVTG